jgi:tetratricopeptide (TPR) repeat protein
MNGRGRKLRFLSGSLVFFLLWGCQSLQKDISLPGGGEPLKEMETLEELIVRLDAPGNGGDREALARARRKVGELQSQSNPDEDYQSLLAAWSGRLSVLEGKPGEAQREYRRFQARSVKSAALTILASRLAGDNGKMLLLIEDALAAEGPGLPGGEGTDRGRLTIERGRILFALNRFAEAVAAFDSAFSLLKEKTFYEETYRIIRDKAWELRDLVPGTADATVTIIGRGELSWLDLVELTKNETDLLRFLTAGRNWSREEIFRRLLDRSFIPLSQDVELTQWPAASPAPTEAVLRSGAAWFIWRLYAENRANKGLLSRYSSRYGAMPKPHSPVADLPLLSPFFDAILGCVESEFFSLPDGRNFFPAERVRGSEFLGSLKKITP